MVNKVLHKSKRMAQAKKKKIRSETDNKAVYDKK